MANQKAGLNYFTIDTDRYQDMRIKRLKKNLGGQGVAVYDYILCEVYRVRGYYYEWNEDTAFDIAEYWGIKETLVQEIVKYCGSVGLFSKELLSRGIITSASIQRRYLDMCARAKRKAVEIPEKYKIVPEECAKITEECAIIPEECPQSKVKESIVKENKENHSLSVSPSTSSGEQVEGQSDEPTPEEREIFLRIFFFKNYKNPAAQVERFINHYKATGWVRKGGGKIKDRIALAECWEPQGDAQKNRFQYPFLNFWKDLYDDLLKIEEAKAGLHLMIDSLLGVEMQAYDKRLVLILEKPLMDYLERATRLIHPLLGEYYPNHKLGYRVRRIDNH